MPKSGCNNDKNERTRIFYPIKDSESFDYKTGSAGNLPARVNEAELEDVKIVVPLKNLSNFMFHLDILLINAEIDLILKWNQNVLTEKATREQKDAVPPQGGNPALPAVNAINTPSGLKFNTTDCKFYVPVVTLQKQYENELKTKIIIDHTWSKYRSQVINQTATNNLNYLIDPTFNKVHRLFVLAFENKDDRSSYSKYYIPTVEIKNYNVILDGQEPFYEMPIRNKEETYKTITELVRESDFNTGNLLNYQYFTNYYKLITIDLSRQKIN